MQRHEISRATKSPAALLISALACLGCPAQQTGRLPVGTEAESTRMEGGAADDNLRGVRRSRFVAVGPRDFEAALAPLFDLRRAQGLDPVFVPLAASGAEGEPTEASTLLASIADALAATDRPRSEPRYLLLVGAAPFFTSTQTTWADGVKDSPTFPTDHPLERIREPRIAVGRLPARTAASLEGMVRKIVAYETEAPGGRWQNNVWVYGGPADFGPIVDAVIEAQATSLLDEFLPQAYDVGVLFANERSPYAYRFDQFGSKLVSTLNAGALIGVYAGHGQKTAFDRVFHQGRSYSIGSREDIAELSIRDGSSLFVSLTCHTGSFGLTEPSIAEQMITREGGPVAVFASSEVSHPYPNLLLGRALIESLLINRELTLGEGVVSAKAKMLSSDLPFASFFVPGDIDVIKRDHLSLYNLFGDPATRLRLPPSAAFNVSKLKLKIIFQN